MFSSLLITLAATACALAASSPAEMIAALKSAPTQNDRIKILDQDKDFTFNFFNTTNATASGGTAISATVSNFPVLVNQGLAMTLGFLEPCGMNTPHTHPRATEMLYLVNGTITSGMIAENGARFVFNTLEAGMAQVFLQGSIHYQQNELCDPVMFVAALSNEDPGVESIAQRYFGLPPDVVAASLGDVGVEQVAWVEEMIPDNFALGRQECLDRCGIKRQGQKSTQRQPRVSANALPSGTSTWPASATKVYGSAGATSTHYSRDPSMQTGNVFGALAQDASTIADSGVSKNVLIALCAVVGAMGIGYIAIGAFWLVSRRRRATEKANRWYVRPEMAGRTRVPTDEKYDDVTTQ